MVNRMSKQGQVAKLELPPGLQAQSFIRHRDNGYLPIAAFDGGSGWQFSLDQVPDYSEFADLYDAFIIDRVDLHFVLVSNNLGKYPVLVASRDYDDAGTPPSEDSVLTRQGAEILPFTANRREHTITVYPRCVMTAFRTGITSAYGWSKPGQLLDIAVPDVPFYGIKTWMTDYNTSFSPDARIRVYFTFHMRMVNQR